MKKKYVIPEAVKIPIENSAMTANSIPIPPSCIQIVANVVAPGGNTCGNPSDTISYMYFGNNPYGD